ncbi:MAG TPA: M24 family metallopeptidase [Pyrinomonadaceae bacterium]|nr:M24 family metallopeptidase [Pyrinomonadaceae bacterium]
MPTTEIEIKTERLLRFISQAGLGGLLINSQPNFSWLTAGGRNGIDLSREAGAGTIFLRHDGKRFVIANRIEMERLLTEELNGQGYEPIDFSWQEEKGSSTLIVDTARSLLNVSLPLGSDLLVGQDVRLVEGDVANARYQLTEAEIERFRLLGRDAGKAIGDMSRTLTPGLTEREVARRAIDALAAVGAHSVVTLVAADDRLKSYRHPVPTALKWEKTLMIVVCARRGGLIASLTRIICSGAVPQDLDLRTRASALVAARLLDVTKPGVSGTRLYELAALAYKEAGFSGEENLHHQGGATGYRTRDWVAHPRSKDIVNSGQAFAWNPSITGSKVEETCLAFEDKIEIITASPDWPTLSVEMDGRAYLLPTVLSL